MHADKDKTPAVAASLPTPSGIRSFFAWKRRRNTGPAVTGRRLSGPSRFSGFTLVEVLVAVVILAVSIVAILSAFNHSLYAFGESRNALKADMLIMDKMAEIELLAARDGQLAAEESNGAFGDENSNFQWECKVTRASDPPGVGADPGVLNQVDLTVWREGSQRRYSVCTFIRTEKKP